MKYYLRCIDVNINQTLHRYLKQYKLGWTTKDARISLYLLSSTLILKIAFKNIEKTVFVTHSYGYFIKKNKILRIELRTRICHHSERDIEKPKPYCYH